MGGSQTDLVAIAGVTSSCLTRDDLLWQFARHSLCHGLIDIACARYAHSLIDICTTRQWVADGTTETGTCSTEGLNLCWVVMGLVLELEQPLLLLAIHVHINEDRASVVLLADLHIVEKAFLAKVTRANSSKFHEAERFLGATELLAYVVEHAEGGFDLLFHEGVVYLDFF